MFLPIDNTMRKIQIIFILFFAISCSTAPKTDLAENLESYKVTTYDVEVIKPTTHLLWYKGFIDGYPIKMMLKIGFDKETNDNQILDMAYAYSNQKKWIYSQEPWKPQDETHDYEKNEESLKLNVDFKYNQVLKGDLNNQKGEILPITLTPMAKELPAFIFNAQIKKTVTSGVLYRSVSALSIYDAKKNIQTLKFDKNSDLGSFNLSYADINYDGYLDLIINDNFFLYNSITKIFETHKYTKDYFPELTELSRYNLFAKSFTVETRKATVEYRTINGRFTPYLSSSYFPNDDGELPPKKKYKNGKWVIIK